MHIMSFHRTVGKVLDQYGAEKTSPSMTISLYPAPVYRFSLTTESENLPLLHDVKAPLQSMLTVPLLRAEFPGETLERGAPADR